MVSPTRDEFRALARDHTVVPVWREVLADLETPVSAFVKLVGAGEHDPPGFLLESVEHAERWGRFSFIGLRSRAHARRPRVARRGRSARRLRTADRPWRARRARSVARLVPRARGSTPCRRSTAGSSATSATTSCARSSTCRTSPTDDVGFPDAVLTVTGHVTAFDHFRQRLYLIENVFLGEPGADEARVDAAYDDAVARLARPRRRARPPAAVRPVAAARRRPHRDPRGARRRWRAGAYHDAVEAARGAHPRRRHLPGRARAALRPRRSGRPVRRVPRAAAGQPVAVHVLRAASRGHARRLVARADGAAARRPGHQPPDRGHAPPGPHRRRRQAHGGRAHRAPEGARRARDARRPRPQRRRAGGRRSAPSRSRSSWCSSGTRT